jgi:Alpha/beta hydrolase family
MATGEGALTTRCFAHSILAGVFGAIIMANPASAAQRAAAIEYDFVERPAGLPAEFAAADGSLKFLAITTLDGNRVEAALWQPEGRAPAATTLLVSVHGSGSNFTKPPIGFLGAGLLAKGYASLAVNTRQHDGHVNTDNFFDVRRDIEAAVYTARALGYRALVLHGHSLGNIQVQFYAANNWDADLRAVILTGAFANLPWKTRHLLVQNEENYRALAEAAVQALRGGKVDEVLPVRMRWLGGENVPVTARHFLTYRSDAASAADGTYWIRRVPRPILLVRDDGDAFVHAFEPVMLLSAATAAGSLVPAIKYVTLPNANPPSAAAHGFIDNKQALVDAIAAWLAEQHL